MLLFFYRRDSRIRFDLADKETLMHSGWSPWFDEGVLEGTRDLLDDFGKVDPTTTLISETMNLSLRIPHLNRNV